MMLRCRLHRVLSASSSLESIRVWEVGRKQEYNVSSCRSPSAGHDEIPFGRDDFLTKS